MITPIRTATYGALPTSIYATKAALSEAAAYEARAILSAALRARGQANIVLATGSSQLIFLDLLRRLPDIDWQAVNVFHMDEWVGIAAEHPASFRAYLRRHIVDLVKPGAFYPIPGENAEVEAICRDYAALLRAHPADLCVMGMGENGHIGFNDPPYADFTDPVWVKVVKLTEWSRRLQVDGEHFPVLAAVPTHAISMTVPALLAAKRILCLVPEARKAEAVEHALLGPITEDCPASILRQASHAHLLLDADSAARLKPESA
jgi:glucosamine-6-phosphate deaminase